jgi:hypothetical protein
VRSVATVGFLGLTGLGWCGVAASKQADGSTDGGVDHEISHTGTTTDSSTTHDTTTTEPTTLGHEHETGTETTTAYPETTLHGASVGGGDRAGDPHHDRDLGDRTTHSAPPNRVATLLEVGSYGKASTVRVDRSAGHDPAQVVQISYLAMRGLADLPVLMLEAASHPYKVQLHPEPWGAAPRPRPAPTFPPFVPN